MPAVIYPTNNFVADTQVFVIATFCSCLFSYLVVVAYVVVIVVVVVVVVFVIIIVIVVVVVVVVVVAIKWQKVICCERKIHSLATFKLGKFCDRAAAAASGDQLISG